MNEITNEQVEEILKSLQWEIRMNELKNSTFSNARQELKQDEKASLTGDKDFDSMLKQCIACLESKGEDYTMGTNDRLHNFRTVAEFTGLTKEQVLGVYFYKHISAIFAFIKNGGTHESEPISSRIMDAINYLLLFEKMIQENKGRETKPKMEVKCGI